MESWFLLYLILKLDSVIVLFGFCAFAFGAVALLYLLHGISASLYEYEYNKEKLEEARRIYFRHSRKNIGIAVVIVFLAVLIPSTKDIIMITGGVGVLEAAKTEQAKNIASKSVLVIEKFLDGYLRETEKK